MPEAMIVIFIDWSSVDKVFELRLCARLAKIGVQPHLDFWVREHFLKHRRITTLRQRLKFLGKVAVIAIGANGYASANAGIELFCITLPLFARVVLEKHFVQLPPNLRYDYLLRVLRAIDPDAPFSKLGLHFLRRGGATYQLLKRI